MELGALSGDLDMFPYEVLEIIARRTGVRATRWSVPSMARSARDRRRTLSSFEPAMRLALGQAAPCVRGGGDVPVGAVVLDGAGAVIGAGHNRQEADRDPTAHAEIVAIRQAAAARGGWRLDGYTLVVTLEPCTMCAGAAAAARLDRLVYGAADPRAGAAGSLWDVLRDRRLAAPRRGDRRRAGAGVRGPAARVLRPAALGRARPGLGEQSRSIGFRRWPWPPVR